MPKIEHFKEPRAFTSRRYDSSPASQPVMDTALSPCVEQRGIGVLIVLGGFTLLCKGSGDGVSQEGGAKFMMLGLAIAVGGLSLVAFVTRRKDW